MSVIIKEEPYSSNDISYENISSPKNNSQNNQLQLEEDEAEVGLTNILNSKKVPIQKNEDKIEKKEFSKNSEATPIPPKKVRADPKELSFKSQCFVENLNTSRRSIDFLLNFGKKRSTPQATSTEGQSDQSSSEKASCSSLSNEEERYEINPASRTSSSLDHHRRSVDSNAQLTAAVDYPEKSKKSIKTPKNTKIPYKFEERGSLPSRKKTLKIKKPKPPKRNTTNAILAKFLKKHYDLKLCVKSSVNLTRFNSNVINIIRNEGEINCRELSQIDNAFVYEVNEIYAGKDTLPMFPNEECTDPLDTSCDDYYLNEVYLNEEEEELGSDEDIPEGNGEDQSSNEDFHDQKAVDAFMDTIAGTANKTAEAGDLCALFVKDSISRVDGKVNTEEKAVPLKCINCSYEFTSKKEYVIHTRSKECFFYDHFLEGKDFVCKQCGKGFTKKEYLSVHVKSVHDRIRPWSCEICGKAYGKKNELQKHFSSVHLNERNFKCELCDKAFSQNSKLQRHVSFVHNKIEKSFACELCPKVFFSQAHLRIHVEGVHYKIRNYKCTICEKSFQQVKDLKHHQKSVHDKLRTFKCEHCDRMFFHKNTMMSHIRAVHLNIRNEKCEQCNFSAPNPSALKSHVDSVHSNTLPFQCNICQQKFKKQISVKYHIDSVHLGLKPYECTFCGGKFTTRDNLREHLLSLHSEKAGFQCSYCDKKFFIKKKLTLHVERIHLKLKKGHCKDCDKAFYSTYELKLHYSRVHNKKKNFQCTFCPKKFFNKYTVRAHIENRHTEVSKE